MEKSQKRLNQSKTRMAIFVWESAKNTHRIGKNIESLSNFEIHSVVTESKQDMCLWNTDAPSGNKVKNMAKSLSPKIFNPPPLACDVSEVWATFIWTCSASLVTVWPPKL